MNRARLFLRFGCCLALFSALSALVSTPRAGATRSHTSTTALWSPITVSLPYRLPDGQAPTSGTLFSTSCSSPSFCVAVGMVTDTYYDIYPLIETYRGGSWVPSVAPQPPDASLLANQNADAVLYSVSCAKGNACGAAGDYTTDGNPGYQMGLLESFSGGSWSATEAKLPSGPNSGIVNLWSVSCYDATCMAVGDYDDALLPNNANQSQPLVYLSSSGSWQLQSSPPLPSNFDTNLELLSVSCPDSADCVVVGGYMAHTMSPGLILTYSSGAWTAEQSPLPDNAATGPVVQGQNTYFANSQLNAVDCSAVGECVAGGGYTDSTGINFDGLLVTLHSGTWTASESPVPSDSDPSGTLAAITGMSCPTTGSCVADGYYWVNYNSQIESGMILTQSSSGWRVTPAPVPVSPQGGRALHLVDASKAASGKTAMQGVSCPKTSFCRAVGSHGKRPLIEDMRRR
jgi:hypothetical protein